MKVLFIASDTNAVGGIQQYNRKFLDSLRSRGDIVELLELKKKGVVAKFLFVLSFFLKNIFFRPDINICAHINYSPLGLFAKKIFRREYIVCTHGVDVWEIGGFLKMKAMREARLITTVAEYTRDKMLKQIPEAKNKIYLLYNPIDGETFVPKKKSRNLIERYGLENKKVIFTISRLSEIEGYKGYDRVIEAMPEILKVFPNAVYLLGGTGGDVPRVERLIEKLGLGEHVIMAGFIPDEEVLDHYNLADVFTMPSTTEGAPAVFVEALSCGIPVIAGNVDGSSTPLQGGKVGLLINPESIEEIAKSIISVLSGKIDRNLLNPTFLREETLKKFGMHHFPKRVNEALKIASE